MGKVGHPIASNELFSQGNEHGATTPFNTNNEDIPTVIASLHSCKSMT